MTQSQSREVDSIFRSQTTRIGKSLGLAMRAYRLRLENLADFKYESRGSCGSDAKVCFYNDEWSKANDS